jgi:hypothetical protein
VLPVPVTFGLLAHPQIQHLLVNISRLHDQVETCISRADVKKICLIRKAVFGGVQVLFANKVFILCVRFEPKFQYVSTSIKSHCTSLRANPSGGR